MRTFLSVLSLVISLTVSAMPSSVSAPTTPVRKDSTLSAYTRELSKLSQQRRQADLHAVVGQSRVTFNPYFYRMLTSGTLYNDALNRMLFPQWSQHGNVNPLISASDAQLARMYVSNPSLIHHTAEQFLSETRLQQESMAPITSGAKLTDKAVPVDLGNDVAEPVVVEAHKPKFWVFKGNGSFQFTQSYFSENWYKGGENNYAAQAQLTLEANYDNKKKLQWNNRLEFQLGFQTSSDTVHNPRVTNNLIRATSRVGYKAAKNWNYAGEVQASTQMFKNFNTNSEKYISGFMAPLYLDVSVGMDYKFKSKKERFRGSLYLAPVAYNMRFVSYDPTDMGLRSRYGIKEGRKSFHNFGPSIKWEFDWDICKNVKWNSKLYYFTNLDYVQVQWENKVRFTINKYLSSEFFFYPRFDDSSTRFRGDNGYWMMREWLSLGVNYDF